VQPPVAPGAEAVFSEGLAVRAGAETETTVTARGPGEVSGPALVVPLTFRNGSTVPVDLDGIRVAASYGGGTPAPSVDGPPTQAPTGVLQPGGTAEGTFAFSMPPGNLRSTTLQITSISSEDVVVIRS